MLPKNRNVDYMEFEIWLKAELLIHYALVDVRDVAKE
jgi:hypothetical protein